MRKLPKGIELMSKQQRILVVGSELNFIKAARRALDSYYTVSTAGTKKEGLKKAKGEAPHMIILGYLEPRGDAFQLHKELKTSPMTQNIPLLVIDVNPEEHVRKGWKRKEGKQMEAEDYITRPVEPAELVTLVSEILNSVAPKPMELRDTLEQMEEVLKQVDKIEEILAQ